MVMLHDYGLTCPRKTLLRPGTAVQCEGPQLGRCLPCTRELYGFAKGGVITVAHRISRRLHGRADRYIAVSAAVADGSRAALPSGADIAVVPASVPNALPALAAEIPRPSFLPPNDGYLMFVGALGPHKGINVLLDAHRRMRHRLPLMLIGTPRDDTPPIDDPNIFVAHNVPGLEVMAAWMRASIAVVPSVWAEPFGLVAVEAMLAGRPVVASDTGGLRDIVEHGTSGLLVPPGDAGALAEAMDRLLGDPALQRRMGEAGRLRAGRFEVASVAPQVIEIMDDAVRVAIWSANLRRNFATHARRLCGRSLAPQSTALRLVVVPREPRRGLLWNWYQSRGGRMASSGDLRA